MTHPHDASEGFSYNHSEPVETESHISLRNEMCIPTLDDMLTMLESKTTSYGSNTKDFPNANWISPCQRSLLLKNMTPMMKNRNVYLMYQTIITMINKVVHHRQCNCLREPVMQHCLSNLDMNT
eukprot:UN23687